MCLQNLNFLNPDKVLSLPFRAHIAIFRMSFLWMEFKI